MEYDEDDFLMLSGIQHYIFCKRQWALIHIEQQWEENYRTTSGMLMHKRAHDESFIERRKGIMIVRGLRVSSRTLGVSGQCDVVEFHQVKDGIQLHGEEGKWSIVPVEYKNGKPKENAEDEMQLCLQALCLEEMFLTEIKEGYLFYGENKRRTQVEFTKELRDQIAHVLKEMHELYKRGYTPKVKTGKQCKACSLSNICLPKLEKSQNVSDYINKSLREDG